MRKICIMLAFIGVAALVASCMSGRTVASTPISSLQGEWTISEINGMAVSPGMSGEMPYIGFDLNEGRISGNSGCNRISGTLDKNGKAGEIDLGRLASTRMACADMTTEQNILNTFQNVKGYRVMSYGSNGQPTSIALTNADSRPIVILKPRTASSTVSLAGSWNIITIRGKATPSGMERKPFISFDMNEMRVHGNAGCNTMNGGFSQEGTKANALMFRQMITTMMACPHLDTEREVLDSLESVNYYEVLANGNLGLFNSDGVMLLELQKQ